MIRLLVSRHKKWKTAYTPKEKVTWVALFLMSLWCVEGAIESHVLGVPGGPRLVLALLTIVSVIWVTYTKDDRRIVISPRMISKHAGDAQEEPEDRSGTQG